MFTIEETAIHGLRLLKPIVRGDARGRFVKNFHAEFFKSHGMETTFPEQYFSTSAQGVLRGLHFQTPPMDHAKLVTCLEGEVLDAVVDLRKNSPTFGQHATFRLNGEEATQVYIPTGCAHGFYTLSKRATLLYNVGTVHSAPHDAGIRWDSAGIAWPNPSPLISERDAGFPTLAQFASPF